MTKGAGTGKYIPPEMGDKHDCFSAGIVMYELMCGECPSAKVPNDKQLAKAFKTKEIDDVVAAPAFHQALDVCKGLTRISNKDRSTAKEALDVIRLVIESLQKCEQK